MRRKYGVGILAVMILLGVFGMVNVYAAGSSDIIDGETGIEDSIFGDDNVVLDSVIVFTATGRTVDYTGKAVSLKAKEVRIVEGNGTVTFTYFKDQLCKVPTFAGKKREGSAPTEPGKYFVKATVAASETHKADTTDGTFALTIRPKRVQAVSAANTSAGIKLSWAKSSEADGYIIYRKQKGSLGEYKQLKKITGNGTLSYVDKSAAQGKGYLYTICAYANAGDGTRVDGKKLAAAKKIIFTKVTSIQNQNGSVKVLWTKVSGAAGYKVYRKVSGEGKYVCVKNIKKSGTNYYVDKAAKTVKNGKAASYYVLPYYEKGDGYVLQTAKKTNCYVSRVAITSVSRVKNGFTVKWKKNSKASGYQIRYSTDKNFKSCKSVDVKSRDTVSKKVSGLAAGKKYYVKVRAYKTYNGVKYYSAW